MKKANKWIATLLIMGLGFSTILTGCGGGETATSTPDTTTANKDESKDQEVAKEQTKEKVTLNVLFKGPKPEGFDKVYEEYLNRTKDTFNIELNMTWVEHADYKEKLNLEMTAGAEYDLVFDAPWIHLKTLAADDYYMDLSNYFNNDEYPGLKAAFPEEVMENNIWYDSMCYIPLFRSLGNGVPAVHYRQDWAEEWGLGEIDNMDEMVAYWDKAKENSILPLSVSNNRGYFQLFTVAGYDVEATKADIQLFTVAGLNYYVYIKDNKVAAIAPEGAGDEDFKDFPEGHNYDFGVKRFETFADWTQRGYISADSMTVTDANTPFYSGQSASKIGTLDDIESDLTQMKAYSPDAVIGEFVYDDACRNMEDGAMTTDLVGNNGLAIPANSKKADDTMRFMDWLFSSDENHDLFELGIEGQDYVLTGEDTYEKKSNYDFPGFGFTWNPNYVKFSDVIEGKNLEYRKWELDQDAYTTRPICGYSFDGTATEIATAVAQVKAVTDKIATTKLHGILSDGSKEYASAQEMLKANLDEAYAAGAKILEDELVKQINTYLASK